MTSFPKTLEAKRANYAEDYQIRGQHICEVANCLSKGTEYVVRTIGPNTYDRMMTLRGWLCPSHAASCA